MRDITARGIHYSIWVGARFQLSSPLLWATIKSMNWKMLGHEWAVQLLKRQIVCQRIRHAYLFTGPQGIGRRTLAIRLAQAINCPNPISVGEACMSCQTCEQIERMQNPDLLVVQSEKKGGILRVDQIRAVQRDLSLAPYASSYRVGLFLRFEEANPSAANALLKTLEEPAARVVLILTAENEELLLPTIVSRCEVIRLRPVPVDQVSQGLQDWWGFPEGQALALARIAGGRPGYALELYHNPDLMNDRRLWLETFIHLLSANRVDRFANADRLVNKKDILPATLNAWLSFWRDVMLLASGSSVPICNYDRLSEIQNIAVQLGLDQIQQTIIALERTQDLIERNVNPRLALEVFMLDLPRIE